MKKHLDFALLVTWLAVSLLLAYFAFSLGGRDFSVYHAAARVMLQGGNPYDHSQLMGEIVQAPGAVYNPYYYAPWFAWMTLPLAPLPYPAARLIWAAVNFLLWLLCLRNLDRLVDWPPAGWRRWAWYIPVTFAFAWTAWGFEQAGILICFLLTAALVSLERSRWTAAGLWLALALFKPNITGLPVAAILLWLLLRKQGKPVLVTAAAVGLMFAVSLVITPGWPRALLDPDKLTGLSWTLDAAGGTGQQRVNTTLLDFLAAYNIRGTAAAVTYGLVIAAGLAALTAALRRSETATALTAVSLVAGFAVTPYALFYDYPVLVLTFFYANSIPLKRQALNGVRIALNVFVFLSLFIGDSIAYRYWMVIGLGTSMIFMYAASRLERADPASLPNQPDAA